MVTFGKALRGNRRVQLKLVSLRGADAGPHRSSEIARCGLSFIQDQFKRAHNDQ